VARICRTSSLAAASVMVSSAGALVPRAVICLSLSLSAPENAGFGR